MHFNFDNFPLEMILFPRQDPRGQVPNQSLTSSAQRHFTMSFVAVLSGVFPLRSL